MGNNDGSDNEKPVHTVYLDSFWIDQTEVTNDMFAAFLNVEGNQSENGATWLNAEDDHVRIHRVDNIWQADSGYEKHPVIEVSWYGAKAYCEWAGRRLPTEAEWEKAARGIDGRIYPWGNSIDCSYANYMKQLGNLCVGDTTPVETYSKGASLYGVLNMIGNVTEWVTDWYGKSYYATYPGDQWPNNPMGPESGQYRVLRGGSWLDFRTSATDRISSDPSHSSDKIGFRCALSVFK